MSWEFARYKETHPTTTALTDSEGNDGVAATATATAAGAIGKGEKPPAVSDGTDASVGTKKPPSSGGTKFAQMKKNDVDKKTGVSFHPEITSTADNSNSNSEKDGQLSGVAGQLTGLFSLFGSPPAK